MDRFASSMEHLLAELERVDLRLRLQALRIRQGHTQDGDDEFKGLYVSEEEIQRLIVSGPTCEQTLQPDFGREPLEVRLRCLEAEIAARRSESLGAGLRLRLCDLAAMFGLSQFEVDTLLMCVLPEIDVRYDKLFGYLHDNVTRKSPSVNLALQCLLESQVAKLGARDSFLPHAPLLAHRLVQVEDDQRSGGHTLLARDLKADGRIVNYLLGSDEIDGRLARCARLVYPSAEMEDLVLWDEAEAQLRRGVSLPERGANTVTYLRGPQGVGKKTLAQALCRAWGLPLLIADVAVLLAEESSPEPGIALAFREARLQGAALYWDRFGDLLAAETASKGHLSTMVRGIAGFPHAIFAAGESPWQPGDALGGKPFQRIELDLPPYPARKRLWEMYLDGQRPEASPSDLEEVAEKFRLTPAQVKDAAAAARNRALGRGERNISSDVLYAACREVSSHRLSTLARKIVPKATWADIVLPGDQMAQLREIANYVKYKHVVFAEWNFERKVSLGKGLNALFTGPSGTGKTMAAEIIANELGLDLYRIDLSTVISKYIGETEKNLDRVFAEARNSNAILFFDEADAVFGKRSEVRDSHDRYANIEIAYLLQKTEEYDGIVILATNLRKNLDEAFARRMHFTLEFPLPEEPDRLRIWRGIFPSEAPLAGDLDLRFMARQFKLSGGNIKNIALAAAFLAASDGGTITMAHLIRGTRREFQKVGRLCTEADFGPYFDLVKG